MKPGRIQQPSPPTTSPAAVRSCDTSAIRPASSIRTVVAGVISQALGEGTRSSVPCNVIMLDSVKNVLNAPAGKAAAAL